MKEIGFFSHEIRDIKYLYVDVQKGHPIKVLCLGNVPEYHPLKVIMSSENESPKEFLEAIFSKYSGATKRYILINTPHFTLIPQKFFSDELKDASLRSLTGDWDELEESVYCDKLDTEEVFLAYRVPNYIYPFLRSEHHITSCYHMETALKYITRKKSFIQRPHCVAVYLQGKNKGSIHGLKKNKLLFMQPFETGTPHDINYHAKYFTQTYFAGIPSSSLQLLVFCPQKSNVDGFLREMNTEHPELLIHVFSEEDIFRSYRMESGVHDLEDFFSLFFSSICEL